ncbi:hypothetical protein PQX77_011709 [Marasmius sp. AFHP31]|nr:hypothetical protein PQX77_011709 [Marasmius sp. AFHP31]
MPSTPPRSRRTKTAGPLPSSTYPFVSPTPTPTKRQKRLWSHRSIDADGHTRLAGWVMLPLELLLQIFERLDIEDLVSVSKLTKQCRYILASPLANPLWQDRLDHHGCPEVPPLMTAFDFVLFLLKGESRCQWRGVVTSPAWIIGKQLCRRCFQDRFVTQASIEATLGTDIRPSILELVPSMRGSNGELRFSVDYFLEAISLLRQGEPVVRVLRTQYNRVADHAARCEEWTTSWNEKKKAQAIKHRLSQVEDMLFAQGFNRYDFQAVLEHHLVKQAGKLHHRDWVEFVFPELVPSIVQSRSLRLSEERLLDRAMSGRVKQLKIFLCLLQRCLSLKLRRCFPNPQTVCLLPVCRDLLIQPDTVVITIDDFKLREGDILISIRSWLQQQQQQLHQCYVDGIPQLQSLTRSFNSAVQWPKRGLTTRGAIAHLNDRILCKPSHYLCPNDAFKFTPSKVIFSLLRLCGLPLDATADDLDHLNPSFRCLHCLTIVGDWRNCVPHSQLHGDEAEFERAPRGGPEPFYAKLDVMSSDMSRTYIKYHDHKFLATFFT